MPRPHRITVDLVHPNAKNAEAFLNSWEEPFVQVEKGRDRFVFRSANSSTVVELFFFDSYQDADAYGMEHFNGPTEKRRWNLNGAMLYAVSGNNAGKVSSLTSHFAGRE